MYIKKSNLSIGSQKEISISGSSTPKLIKSQTHITVKTKCSPQSSSKIITTTPLRSLKQHQTYQRSLFSSKTHSDTSDTYTVITDCISLLKYISEKSQLSSNEILEINVKEKMSEIEQNIEEIFQYQNSRIQNQTKITTLMQQLMEQKMQKQQSMKSGESLIKQQADQITQLKLRISLYQ